MEGVNFKNGESSESKQARTYLRSWELGLVVEIFKIFSYIDVCVFITRIFESTLL